MQLFNRGLAVAAAGLVLALVFAAPTVVQGDEWNWETRFSVNHEFEVPNKVLDANTEYVMRLHDSPNNRRVIQILNEDESQLLTQFMAVSAERPEPMDETTFEFMEVDPGYPKPIQTWFYPGRNIGVEFIYPDEQLEQIAAHQGGRGLATRTAFQDPDTADKESYGVTPDSTDQSVQEDSTFHEDFDLEAEERSEGVEIEPQDTLKSDTESDIERSKPSEEVESTEEESSVEATPVEEVEEGEELPRTAGELPLFGLLGLVCLGLGFGLKAVSARS
jgi:hypothetical protein